MICNIVFFYKRKITRHYINDKGTEDKHRSNANSKKQQKFDIRYSNSIFFLTLFNLGRKIYYWSQVSL